MLKRSYTARKKASVPAAPVQPPTKDGSTPAPLKTAA
jgi:hypothetical protein